MHGSGPPLLELHFGSKDWILDKFLDKYPCFTGVSEPKVKLYPLPPFAMVRSPLAHFWIGLVLGSSIAQMEKGLERIAKSEGQKLGEEGDKEGEKRWKGGGGE